MRTQRYHIRHWLLGNRRASAFIAIFLAVVLVCARMLALGHSHPAQAHECSSSQNIAQKTAQKTTHNIPAEHQHDTTPENEAHCDLCDILAFGISDDAPNITIGALRLSARDTTIPLALLFPETLSIPCSPGRAPPDCA
jgi:hypothetical protein